MQQEIYSRGTKLAEVPPDFHGTPWSEFERRYRNPEIWREAAEHRKTAPRNLKLENSKIIGAAKDAA